MIDIRLIRENSKIVKENIKKKFQKEKLEFVDKVIQLDEQWRKKKYEEDTLRSTRNKISEQINQLMKAKKKKEAQKYIVRAKKIPDKIKVLQEKRRPLEKKIKEILSQIPNLISKRTPLGRDDSKNVVEKVIGKPKKFSFNVKSHVDIAEKLSIADFDSSSRVAGNGFYYIEGDLALLSRALLQYALDKMISKGFRYIETPLLLQNDIINRVTDLHDQDMMIYRIDGEEKSLIGTSEHSLIGRYVDQEIDAKMLPLKQTSYSMCFRKEIGSHGIDQKGLFRTHQFNKIEMVVICHPKDSEKFFEELKSMTVDIFKGLELPIRVLQICSGDLGDLKYEQIDVEAYSPRKKAYFEVGSCSNLTDAQARKLGISTRVKGERIVPHTLNNTAIATSRALVAILENNQQKDGSIVIPKILRPYMGGKERIE